MATAPRVGGPSCPGVFEMGSRESYPEGAKGGRFSDRPVDPAEAVRVTKEVFGFPTLRSCRDYLKGMHRRAQRERERVNARIAELGFENAFREHQLLEALPADFTLP